MPAPRIIDDGTLDIVVQCVDCLATARYPLDLTHDVEIFKERMMEEFYDTHVCEADDAADDDGEVDADDPF